MTGDSSQRQRIDKWLWHARVIRTRSDAAKLVEAGHVRVNSRRTTSSAHLLRAGDVLTISLDRSIRLVRVVGFCERRGPPAAGRALYEVVAAKPD